MNAHRLPPTIVWFRNDLRLDDNPALSAAYEKGGEIIPLFIWDPDEEGEWAPGAASRWWLHNSLISLQTELKSIGLSLIIRQGNTLDVLKKVIQETKANAICWNINYGPSALQLENLVSQELSKMDIYLERFNGNLLYDPQQIYNKQGRPFQVFTPFWKHCLSLTEPSLPLKKIPLVKTYSSIYSDSIDSLDLLPHIHWDNGLRAAWKPGCMHAKHVLEDFLSKGIENYQEGRDRADLPGVSRISPYLHFGEISPRMIYHAANKLKGKRENEGIECYIREIGWREFAHYLLYHFPKTTNHPLREQFERFPWITDSVHLQTWQNGKTGYPLVDAGMRQLWATGWMHNRLRMIVGSFLVKHLRISWLEGSKWFWDTLVDADLANNTLGWQWVGGCGADAAPYFRIFNPVTQSEKCDPDGNYVRKWVPELSKLPTKWIHHPWEAPEEVLRMANVILGKSYPYPIVDHIQARNAALEAFKSLRDV